MARTFVRGGEVRDNFELDSINVEMYVKELASLLEDAIQATGKTFEEEHSRMINRVTSIHPGDGDKGLFRQWYQKFTTALG